nr:hypothetical protein [Bacilli bacterium]
MKESIGLTFTINIMIVFILVAMVFVTGILSYTKAFKAASLIVKSLERFEGYNELAYDQININLSALSYMRGDSSKCPLTRSATIGEGKLVTVNNEEKFNYCVYFFDNDGDEKHYSYGVVTYITIDFNMFNIKLKLPIYGRTTRIYRFTNT